MNFSSMGYMSMSICIFCNTIRCYNDYDYLYINYTCTNCNCTYYTYNNNIWKIYFIDNDLTLILGENYEKFELINLLTMKCFDYNIIFNLQRLKKLILFI
jgi:hypothetical protein